MLVRTTEVTKPKATKHTLSYVITPQKQGARYRLGLRSILAGTINLLENPHCYDRPGYLCCGIICEAIRLLLSNATKAKIEAKEQG